jgi:hypothetical protein
MAYDDPSPKSEQHSPSRIGVLRLAATAGVGAALIFVLCWLATFSAFGSPTHAYIALFTEANFQSGAALMEGGFWSLLFGGLSGGLMAFLYNMFGGLERQ